MPNWKDFHTNEGKGGFKPAFAFCNEEGKVRGLLFNPVGCGLPRSVLRRVSLRVVGGCIVSAKQYAHRGGFNAARR